MEHSELFLLLPRYEEVEGQPEYIRTKGVMTENEILKVIENINEICRFIANENYEGYYDADNVSSFLYPVETMEECYPSIKTRMRMVMSRWGENWLMQKVQKDTESYMCHGLPIRMIHCANGRAEGGGYRWKCISFGKSGCFFGCR